MEYNCLILINIQMCLNVCGHLRFPETRSTTATTNNNWKILPEGFGDFVQREKAHEIRAPKRKSGESLFLQFSRSAVSDSLPPHGLQHASLPCPASLHQLPELTQTHVHWVWVMDIQPSHPLSSPSPPTFTLSQHQRLFQWISSSNQVAKVLEFQLQHQSFQWIFRTDFL